MWSPIGPLRRPACPARTAGTFWQSPNMAEAAGELAYSADKADAKKIEQMSWVGGPSLDILSKHLDEAQSQSLIPYAPTLSQYITADEAKARYDNLKKWYTDHGHFWVGTGSVLSGQGLHDREDAGPEEQPGLPGSGRSLGQVQLAQDGHGGTGWSCAGQGRRYRHL